MRIELSQKEIESAMFGLGSPGVCIACGMFDEYAGCEPDAENYECHECGENQLFGLEAAIIIDAVYVT